MKHKFRGDGSHYNGGEVFFGYGYRVDNEPRLKMIRRWYRKERGRTEDRFYVDGELVDSYDAALTALATPPIFTLDEIAALKTIGDDPQDWRKIIGWKILEPLRDKGAIEWGPPGLCKRTDFGRAIAEK